MSARLRDIQAKVGATRGRLEDWARRVAALRERLAASSRGEASAAAAKAPGPLFQGPGAPDGALDDVELHFEVVDTEDPGREDR
jgi:hypothetical protein